MSSVPMKHAVRLVYFRFSPDSDSRQILLMIDKRGFGSTDFELCRRCRRVHIWQLGVLAGMQGEGYEVRTLRMIQAMAPDDYRWTRSGLASRTQEFWDQIPAELRGRSEVPCEHMDQRPGRVRNAWACLRYWRITGKLYWPNARSSHAAVLTSKAARKAAPERLQAQLDQARQELADAEQRAADATLRKEVRRARKARKNAAARIDWLRNQIGELE
jgi:hypothetical protein